MKICGIRKLASLTFSGLLCGAILHDPKCNCFSRTLTCNRQMDRHITTVYTALAKHRAVQVKTIRCSKISNLQKPVRYSALQTKQDITPGGSFITDQNLVEIYTLSSCCDMPKVPLCENMMSSTKSELCKILQCHQRRTKPQPQ